MAFLLIYIREAHALDGERPVLRKGSPLVEEPLTLLERNTVAETCVADLGLDDFVTLVDDMENTVNQAYAGHPDRLYLVGRDGTLVFQGEPGPRGFDPDLLAQTIIETLKEEDRQSPSSP